MNITEAEFEQMVRNHDLTFMYSDDGEIVRRGRESLRKIRQAAALLPEGVGVRIFNEHVDKSLREPYRKDFYLNP